MQLIPANYRLAAGAIGVTLLCVLLGAGLYGAYRHGTSVANAKWQAKWADELARQAQATAQAEAAARAEEQRRLTLNQQVAEHALESQRLATADALGATAATQRLQLAARTLANRAGGCSGHPTTAGTSPAANHAALVLSDLLSRADQRATELAALADQSRVAGQACEAAYDGLQNQGAVTKLQSH